MHGDVGCLWSLTSLTRLQLSGHDVRGSWEGLRRLTTLRSLDLHVFDGKAVLRALSALRALTSLTLKLWKDDNPDWAWHNLGALSQLQMLVVSGFDRAAASVAAQLPRLAATLSDVQLHCDGAETLLARLAPCTGLTRLSLHVRHPADLPAAALVHLAPLARSLLHLKIQSFSIKEPEAALTALAACSQLTYLVRSLRGLMCPVAWPWNRPAPSCHAPTTLFLACPLHVQSLAFTRCGRWGAEDAWESLQSLARLRSLDLGDCYLQQGAAAAPAGPHSPGFEPQRN